MPLLTPGALPRSGQRCLIDGQPAVHTGKGEFHLVNAKGETVMREGRTLVLVTRSRMNEYLALAATLEGGVDHHVQAAEAPGDSWISGTIASELQTSGILVTVLPSSAEIELLGPEHVPTEVERIGGSADAEIVTAP